MATPNSSYAQFLPSVTALAEALLAKQYLLAVRPPSQPSLEDLLLWLDGLLHFWSPPAGSEVAALTGPALALEHRFYNRCFEHGPS